MKTVKLNNGIDMPVIGFGTFQITDSKQCEESVITAINAGYRLIDTAEAYGNEDMSAMQLKIVGLTEANFL